LNLQHKLFLFFIRKYVSSSRHWVPQTTSSLQSKPTRG